MNLYILKTALKQARLFQESEEWGRCTAAIYGISEVPPEPCGDDRVDIVAECSFLDLGKVCANVVGEGPIDSNMGHFMGWMTEALELRLGLAFRPD